MTKTREWINVYNSFNSMKVMLWREHLEAIVAGKFLPPVTVDTDPTNLCNYNCIWCNAKGYRNQSPSTMTTEHLLRLADFYKEWGVYSTCIAGGGEPTLHPGLSKFIYRLKDNGVQSGVITNGYALTNEQIEAIAKCSRWCGFSIDAGDPETYIALKGLTDERAFNRVLDNIRKLVEVKKELGTRLDIAYKFLIHPDNAHTILLTAKLARSLGVQDFHLRPVCWDNLYNVEPKKPIDFFNIHEEAQRQIAEAQKLETDNFHVYGVTHKFGENWERNVKFKKCRATPLLATFGADGYCHLCFDVRGKQEWILCSHYPDPHEILKVWGGNKHKRMIESIDPYACPRCTFQVYNEIIEQVIIQDKMCMYFP